MLLHFSKHRILMPAPRGGSHSRVPARLSGLHKLVTSPATSLKLVAGTLD